MPTALALIRAINVGGNNPLPMVELRALCEALGWESVTTYIQSGNVVFQAPKAAIRSAAADLEDAIEESRGFRPRVIIRTLEQWEQVIKTSPFAGPGSRRPAFQPMKVLVLFLADTPSAAAAKALDGVKRGREELVLTGRELHLHFPDGVGRSKLSMPAVEKALGVAGTARNWNTILKLQDLAEATEARSS